jgi:magnesium-transporting ATPase (P-type)
LTFAFKQLKNDQIDIYTQEDIESGLTLIAATGVEDLL